MPKLSAVQADWRALRAVQCSLMKIDIHQAEHGPMPQCHSASVLLE